MAYREFHPPPTQGCPMVTNRLICFFLARLWCEIDAGFQQPTDTSKTFSFLDESRSCVARSGPTSPSRRHLCPAAGLKTLVYCCAAHALETPEKGLLSGKHWTKNI
ncbi:uncharacterized protein VTP21DRAFT_1618 [Calcarisporiella thermophila]|uniref:uncharacterized protein n=1 Tax=Calcarisporiella thermophila TaxID=911321 RepID=UPI0037445922